MKQRRCSSPDHPEGEDRWHDAKIPCPKCGDAPVFNKALQTAMLNNHLYGQAETQRKEVSFVKKAYREKEPNV